MEESSEKSSKGITERTKDVFEDRKHIITDSLALDTDKMFWGAWGMAAFAQYDVNLLQAAAIGYGTSKSIGIGSSLGQVAQQCLDEGVLDKRHPGWFMGSVMVASVAGYYGNTLTHDLVTGAWLPQDDAIEKVQPAPDTFTQKQQDYESGTMVRDGYTLDFN